MNAAIEALERVEAEVAQLLAAGLGTRRAGCERLEALAADVARLRLERLAVELRSLATTDDATKAAGAAMACLTLARKLRERLDAWPEIDVASGTLLRFDSEGGPNLLAPFPAEERGQGVGSDLKELGLLYARLLSGDSLARADAARQLVALGDAGVPTLSRLAERGTLAVRREVIACLGEVGTEAALRSLVSCLGYENAQRTLLGAARAFGDRAAPALAGVVERDAKKGKDASRRNAAWLLYRLGADDRLDDYSEDLDPVVAGFGLAARARRAGAWQAIGRGLGSETGSGDLTRGLFAALQAEAAGEVGPIVEVLDQRTANRVEDIAKYLVGTPNEAALGEHYVTLLTRGTAKDKKRGEAFLAGLADPTLVPKLAAAYDRGEVDVVALCQLLGEIGGDQAVGLLLDVSQAKGVAEAAASALGQIGEPSVAPRLFEQVQDGSTMLIQAERALVGLGDSAVDYLAGELCGNDARALRAQRILLQIKEQKKSESAARALEGTDPESLELLLSYLGHPVLGKSAVGKLGRRGDSVLDALSDVVYHGAHPARLDAIAAISAVKTPRASAIVHDFVEGIIDGGSSGSDAHVAAKGIELLPTIRNERTAPLVARGIGVVMKMPQVASAASEALPRLGHEAVAQTLPYLDHSNAYAKVLALRALGGLAAPEAEARAIELLGDPDFSVAYAATDALGQIGRANGSIRILDALEAKAMNPSAGWPAQYLSALGATRNPAAIPRLRAIAKAFRDRRSPLASHVEIWVTAEIQKLEKDAERAAAKAETPANAARRATAAQPEKPESGGLLDTVRRLFGGK